jgi:hypothetical protein
VETYPLKNPSPWRRRGSKKKPKRDKSCSMLSVGLFFLRFWATFPGHGCEQGVCHKDSSSNCVTEMSNPITHITRILLATERSRRRKMREKQKLARNKIYSLCHN